MSGDEFEPPELVVGESRETSTIDFKAVFWSNSRSKSEWPWQAELAKDVAAFANSEGGDLVVGAKESVKRQGFTYFHRPKTAAKLGINGSSRCPGTLTVSTPSP